ncbi:uncharacterized protein LOC133799945 [Humulus lupulus]|uniref:uncharacterized protein LOC133799945 n=1 Tax=Humulus lupulus TaxID=3486 RepID=UPI002B41263C|nr:uncharacterized protein LOC133799945 [Humulus lupulus]
MISDRKKGLENAVGAIFSGCEVRYCVRHLHANFKKEYPRLLLKQILWAAANTTTQAEFARAMQEVKDVSDAILDARDKPIITLLEKIRFWLMSRFYNKKIELEKMTQPVGKRILKIIEKKKEVQCSNGSAFVVDLKFRTCTCRRFQLFGLPCGHALATIWFMGGLNPIDPPPEMKLSGRPKTAKTRETDEPPPALKKARRAGQVKTCSNCLKTGHMRETCKYANVVENRVVKKRGRPPLQKPTEATFLRKERRLKQHAKGGTSGANNALPDTGHAGHDIGHVQIRYI